MTSRYVPAPGALVRIRVSGLGNIMGEVVRIRAIACDGVGEFSVKFVMCSKRRDQLASNIAWRYNVFRLGMKNLTDPDLGRIEGAVKVVLDDERIIVARMVDVSLMGVTFESLESPEFGDRVRIGALTGHVQDTFDDRFEVSFDPPRHPEDVDDPIARSA